MGYAGHAITSERPRALRRLAEVAERALRARDMERFMKLHIAWHVSIILVALLWLGHTACGWLLIT